MQPLKTITYDIESNNLLNEDTIDYLASPYKLKNTFAMHCIVVEVHDTGELIAFYNGNTILLDGRTHATTNEGEEYRLEQYDAVEYKHMQLSEFRGWIKNNVAKVVGHNIINFDNLVCKLHLGMDYTVEPDSWDGNDIEISDTLVTSKTLNPDRYNGHSLDALGKRVGLEKIEFRKHLHKDVRFKFFFADMLYYCIRDVQVNTRVYNWLEKEKKGWDWDDAISLEKSVAELVTRQEHRGFKFDKELAESNIIELDALMEERRIKVEPVLPPRKATQKFLQEHTPSVRQIKTTQLFPPKLQFKKDGTVSAMMEKFVDKHGEWVSEKVCRIYGKVYDLPLDYETSVQDVKETYDYFTTWVESVSGIISDDFSNVIIEGEKYSLPMDITPLKTEMVATISDTTHIKDWLVGMGWIPSEWKTRDLTTNQKKEKLTDEAFEKAVDKYVEQTLTGNFYKARCEHLKTTRGKLKNMLMARPRGRSILVLTNPSFTVGQDKEMCRDLDRISADFPYAKDIIEYLTYRHRRNSILGGGLEYGDEEDAEKGYLAHVREDGRIPTPADTCGAGTSRFKHKICANIPRITSLYGYNMRALFGVDDNFYQLGYDFDSLEAREEAHYCWKHDDGDKEYCNSLTQSKPNDVHSVLARKISKVIGKEFKRSPAKSVKYGVTYGAGSPRVAQIIGSDLSTGKEVFDAFWSAAHPLESLKEALTKYWETTGGKKFILGIDGRRVPTRSAHAILNSLFQSAGVICAKRAAVIHDKLLREASLTVDFFVDDWKNKSFVQQIIMYHDETQLEVSKKQVRFKMFTTKEDAEAYKKESTFELSDISEAPDGRYFIAYCKAGALAVQAVKAAGEYYNLNIPLTAGYIVGKNWATCH